MIALHAWRSADAIEQFADRHPDRKLIVAITGTDAYRFINSHPETTLKSIDLADCLVGLHELIYLRLPEEQRHKMNVIYQSAQPVSSRRPYQRFFHVSVMGHLREEKDPMRPALAARLLPESSRIQVHQYGKAHNAQWAELARAEMARNARYTWHDEVPHYQIRQVYRRTNLLVLPSRMEGGANVISEAIVAGAPVIASDIEGSIGLLGKQYPGYYPVEDEHALCKQMYRCETDQTFYRCLESACVSKQSLFTPEVEQASWQTLLNRLTA